MFGYSITDIASAAVVVTSIIAPTVTLIKMIIKKEFEPIVAMVTATDSRVEVIENEVKNITLRMNQLESLPEKVSQLQIDMYKSLANTATKEELLNHANNTSQAIQRIHDRIDDMGLLKK